MKLKRRRGVTEFSLYFRSVCNLSISLVQFKIISPLSVNWWKFQVPLDLVSEGPAAEEMLPSSSLGLVHQLSLLALLLTDLLRKSLLGQYSCRLVPLGNIFFISSSVMQGQLHPVNMESFTPWTCAEKMDIMGNNKVVWYLAAELEVGPVPVRDGHLRDALCSCLLEIEEGDQLLFLHHNVRHVPSPIDPEEAEPAVSLRDIGVDPGLREWEECDITTEFLSVDQVILAEVIHLTKEAVTVTSIDLEQQSALTEGNSMGQNSGDPHHFERQRLEVSFQQRFLRHLDTDISHSGTVRTSPQDLRQAGITGD